MSGSGMRAGSLRPPARIADNLVRSALDRMPPCGLVIVLTIVGMFPLGDVFGVRLPTSAQVPCGVVLAGAAGLALAAHRKKIPRRWAHEAAALLWATAPAIQLFGEAINHQGMLIASVMLAILCAPATQFHTGWLVATTSAAAIAWLPLGHRDLGAQFPLGALSVGSAVAIAILWHVLELRATARQAALADDLLHAQKMDAIGTLAAGLAHDLNNILAGVIGTAEQIDAPAARPEIAQLIREAERGAALTRNLLGFSRRGQYRKAPTTLAAVIEPVVALLGRTLPKGISLDVRCDPEAAVDGDPAQLGQAVIHLCVNAADALGGEGKIAITATRHGDRAVLAVADRGAGMAAETRARIFEPFFTTKAPTGGTGLGLAMVFGTVQAHGGTIEVDTAPGAGTTMRLVLPAVTPPAVAPRPEAAAATAVPGKVLVIDDEPIVRSVIQRSLRRLGLDVLTAGGGSEGVALVEAHRDLDLVILDMSMPDLGGPETFVRIRAREPDLQVLIASGYALDRDAQHMLANGAVGFLEKPFNAAALADAVRPWLGLRGKSLAG
jgi:signal transduction histidine kinase/CheY-like chemotaxis protein